MLNTPGANGGTPKKVRAVTDLDAEFKKLNQTLEVTKKLSDSIAANFSKAGGKKASGPGSSMSFGESTSAPSAASSSMGFAGADHAKATMSGFVDDNKRGFKSPDGFVDEPGSGSMGFRKFAGTAALTAFTAASEAISPQDYLENDMARRRFGFYAGVSSNTPMGYTRTNAGTQYGGDQIQHMMNSGTGISAMDAAQASMLGNSNGLMSGLSNYTTIANNAAMASNLSPGIGLQGGMQAMAALNQASSVNKLRMIGIQIRDPNSGLMRSYKDIANDLWNMINRQKVGGEPLTAQDLSLSLQPGNSLASLMDQYFGNDAVLRQNVIAALYQKVSGKGFSKQELNQTGALPSSAASGAARFAKGYNVTNKYTTSGVQGIEQGNAVLGAAADAFAGAVNQFGGIVQGMAALQTISGGGNGAGGTILSGIASGLSAAGGIFGLSKLAGKGGLSLFGNLFKGGGAAAAEGGAAAVETGAAARGLLPLATGLLKKIPELGFSTVPNTLSPEEVANMEAGTNKGWLYDWTHPKKGGDSSPWASGGLGDSSPTANGAYLPLNGGLQVPKDGEFWNQAPWRKQPHHGVDLHADTGTPIYAIKDGEVIKSGEEGDLGTMIRIRHDDGYSTVYGHLSQGIVGSGKVRAGQLIGKAGYSGGVYPKGPKGAHLHVALEDSKTGKVSNPMPYIQGGAHPTEGGSGVYGSAAAATTTPSSHSLFNMSKTSLFSSGGGDSSPGSTSTSSGSSYGNVTVHINVSGANMDEHKLAREVKRVLEDEARMKRAVSR